jgi:hypothetical protein
MLAGAAAHAASAQPQKPSTPEFYVWRQFVLRTGTQPRRLAAFLEGAALPALNRLGHTPVGVFEVVAGVPSPSVFVLIPCPTAESALTLETRLQQDAAFGTAGAAYLEAPATDPLYVRQEVSVLGAIPKVPRIEVPKATAAKAPRLFELRTYESHSERANRLKVQMFDEMGEIEIFRKVGLTPVFFGRTLAGPRMPSLTYMLVHDNMAAREKAWDAFRTSPDWKALAATPGYSDAEIVSNITTVYLRPSSYSQI